MLATVKLTLHLGDDIKGDLTEAVKDEIMISSRKWKVKLTEEETARVVEQAMNQLRSKVNFCYNAHWDFEDDICLSLSGSSGEYSVPSADMDSIPFRFIRGNSGWQIDAERREESIKPSEMPSAVEVDMHTWARTATFHGVGSYKE